MPDELVKSRVPTGETPREWIGSLASRYEALLRASRAISSYREPVALFRALASELQHAVTFDYLGLFLYDESLNKIEMPVLHVVNGPGVAIPADLRPEETITWWVYHNQQPVVILHAPDERCFPRIMEIYKRCGVQSAVVLPVTTAHRRLGGITLGSEQAGAYSEEEVRYLELVADHVALAVDSVLRDEEQRRSEENLRKQKAHFEKLFALAPEAIVLRDIENRVLRVNEEFTKLFGYTVDEALGQNISSLIVPDDRKEECEKLREALKRDEKVNVETIRRRKDGKLLTVSLVAAPVSVEGDEREIYGIYRDITGRKQAEERLRRSEAYLAEGQRLSHTGSWARSVSTGELYWSRESFLIFGLDPAGPSPTLETLLRRVHPEDRDLVRDTLENSKARRSDFEIDYRIIMDQGMVRHIQAVGHPVINASGELSRTPMFPSNEHSSNMPLPSFWESLRRRSLSHHRHSTSNLRAFRPDSPHNFFERRPDIAAAERRVAESNEQIGIARAAFFPTIALSASAGFEGNSITNWFNWPSRFWAVGPSAVETLFDAGRRRATSQAALANYDATVAGYRETTLTALQQVEDNLAALRILEQEAQQQKDATVSAQESLQVFTDRYIGGADPYLQVLTAQTIALQNERNDVDILRRRMDASVLLIKALGGGWDVSQLPKVAQLR
jgi:PAS domain S-box-containing protein